jgi:hypothetical protein
MNDPKMIARNKENCWKYKKKDKSKKKGRNCYTFFNQSYSDSEKKLILIETELREAIKKKELHVVYHLSDHRR